MSAYNVGDYYHHSLPVGQRLREVDAGDWTGAAPTTLTVQPGASTCYFIKKVEFRIASTFAMSAGDTIVMTVNAYGNATFEQHTITDTNPITQLIRLGEFTDYEYRNIDGTNYHIVTMLIGPPWYLRNSPTTAESAEFVYNDVGGGVSAGSLDITVTGWKCLEADSGVTV